MTTPHRLLVTGAVLLFAANAFAQFRGGIEGSVIDPSGAIVPGADITLRDPSTSSERRATSGSGGFFRFPELAPGTYTIVAKKTGFADLTLNDIAVSGE